MTKEETACPGHNASGSVYRKKALEPFVHQVSGRAHMLSLDPSTICKSLSTREWKFYNELPISLKNFTPRLKGLLFVHLEKESGCSHRFMSSDVWMSSESASNSVNNFNVNKKDKNGGQGTQVLSFKSPEMACWNRSFEQTLFKGLERVQYNTTDGFTSHAWTVDKDQEAVTEALGRNPWALRQHKREINRTLKGDTLRKEVDLLTLCEEVGMRKETKDANQNDRYTKVYLLLEDVTVDFNFPSILDLKIGTQLDRSGCSQAKKDKHYNLVKRSSTGSLGLRLAGMQVYQITTGQYLCRDKYYGRGLSTKGFNDALAQFLHNGRRTVTEVITPIVDRLMALRNELEKQDSFRFHASSVLISYEGKTDANSGFGSDASSNEPKHDTFENAISSGDNNLINQGNHLRVGVHMIDFAHSTFKGFLEDKTVYEGPDKDCLHALDNLVSVLNNIKKNALLSPN